MKFTNAFAAALVAFAALTGVTSVEAASPPLVTISGTVVDEATGLSLSGAKVTVLQTRESTVTDSAGSFRFSLLPGRYVLEILLTGYQLTDSTPLDVGDTGLSAVTLGIQRVQPGTSLHTIASTTSRASQTLQSASIVYANLSPAALQNQGYFGLGQSLANLPDVDSTITFASKGAYENLSIRGIGAQETVVLVDGHQANNFEGSYDFSNTPNFGLRSAQVIYGSGTSGLYSVDAIGGVVDMQTLEPTLKPSYFLSQSFGTFNELTSIFQATGTLPKGAAGFKGSWGYAVALGVDGDAGQFRNSTVYSPFAAFDASAPAGTPEHDIGYQPLNTTFLSRSSLFKLRYNVNDYSRWTGDVLTSDTFSDQSGSQGVYETHAQALAQGKQFLSFKLPTDPCPAGTFTATNFAGYPNGFNQNGQPDGGVTCQTPQQYANFNTGYELFGPFTQNVRDTDTNLRFESSTSNNDVTANVYTNTYQHFDVGSGLPWIAAFTAATQNLSGADTGIQLTEDHTWKNNEAGIGFAWRNSAQLFNSTGSYVLYGPNYGHEYSYFFRDVYHPEASPLTIYAYDWIKRSSLTETTYNDPRIALVYGRHNDVVRAAVGAVATQPDASEVGTPFVPFSIGQFSGLITCGVPNEIGAAPGTLKPERATDEELSYGHRLGRDSIVQVSAYNEIVRDKFFFTTESLSAFGTAGISPALLQQFENAYTAVCGVTPNVLDDLSLYGIFNIGRVQASGINVQGRQHLARSVSLDYAYDVQSTKLLGATPTFLRGNLSMIPGSQLPLVPLHTASFGLNVDEPSGFSAHLNGYYFSANNPRNSPPYTLFSANVNIPVNFGTFNIAVQNLFNFDATANSLLCGGIGVPLNAYATAADYTPCLGPATGNGIGQGGIYTGLGGRRLILTLSRRFQ